ncbi:MAG: hypothetical protein ABEN55_12540 [Bradymonadaceae bacterium]
MDPETYNELIEDLKVGQVNLTTSRARAHAAWLDFDTCSTDVEFEVLDYEPLGDDGTEFMVVTRATLSFRFDRDLENFDEGDSAGYVAAEHTVYYRSSVPITDEIFEVFADGNVQFHVWPFVREYVQDVTRRFGWPNFTLPTFVSSNDESSDDASTNENSAGED